MESAVFLLLDVLADEVLCKDGGLHACNSRFGFNGFGLLAHQDEFTGSYGFFIYDCRLI